VLAGTQSLHTNAFDEAFSVPTPRSEKLALRTQQIIAHESGVANTADPLAGSYYLESLTNEMDAECRKIFKEIEALGGVLSAIEKGYYQRAIADAAFRYQRDIETKHRVVVGLNAFIEDEDIEMQLREPEADFERKKVAELKKLKNNRDNGQIQEILKEIKAVAGETDSTMPTLIKAVKSYATLGEIIGVLREVFGEYREDAVY
jgi:methylmalonyl-CoA mutase N-terminal domain/subunit